VLLLSGVPVHLEHTPTIEHTTGRQNLHQTGGRSARFSTITRHSVTSSRASPVAIGVSLSWVGLVLLILLILFLTVESRHV
jgi:hypothetical protein